MQYLILIAGFVLLIKGADFFVDGSSGLAKRLRVPTMVIGLTVVAMGTSLPETAVSVSASLDGMNDLAISNAIGSNLFNLLIVCGVCAMISPISIKKLTLIREVPISIATVALLMVFGIIGGSVNRIEGIILLAAFTAFMFYTVIDAKKARNAEQVEDEVDQKILKIWQCAIFIVGGAAAIVAGGKMVVSAATEIAHSFDISENVIGLTIVAFGTSLPELCTSVVAAKRGETDLALGNVIGSNIFNILLVLGVATTISPVAFVTENLVDCVVLISASVLTMIFCATKLKLVRWEGAVMVAAYFGYMGYICIR